jgi:acetyl/propionyl-CoA carboxylase alpha subunit
VAQYLVIEAIIKICVSDGVKAVHPGYGFLFDGEALANSGITFVGPTVKYLRHLGQNHCQGCTTTRRKAAAN